MNIEALKYYHRLRHLGCTHDASRHAVLMMFAKDFFDYAKRARRYIEMPIFPEFMKFDIDDAGIVSFGTEGEILQALNRKAHSQFRL